MNLVDLPDLGKSVPARRIYKLLEKVNNLYPEFLNMVLIIMLSLYNGNICYRKPHSFNNIRIRLSDFVNHLIPAGLKPDLSNLLEATQKAIMACSRDQYSVRKSILNTAKCVIKPLRGEFKYAERIMHALSKINISRIKESHQPVLKYDELDRAIALIEKSDSRPYNKQLYSIYLKTSALSGLRVSECTRLTLDNVDFLNDRLFVQPSKNGKSRWIGINKDLKPILENYVNNIRPKSKYQEVFLLEAGRPLTLDRVQNIFKRLRKLTGLKDLKPHALRRLFCTYFAGKGVPLPHLQMALGQSSIAMVMRYCRPDVEEIIKGQVNW